MKLSNVIHPLTFRSELIVSSHALILTCFSRKRLGSHKLSGDESDAEDYDTDGLVVTSCGNAAWPYPLRGQCDEGGRACTRTHMPRRRKRISRISCVCNAVYCSVLCVWLVSRRAHSHHTKAVQASTWHVATMVVDLPASRAPTVR